jgi:nicotinamidase-related amidase
MNMMIERIERGKCCLLVIDLQERLMPAIHDSAKVVDNTVLMLRCAGILGLPVLTTTQYSRGLGGFVPEIAGLVSEYVNIDKTEFNAFANDEFASKVGGMAKGGDTLIITGVESHICIYQTAIGALRAGFRPWIVSDAVSSRNSRHHEEAMSLLRSSGICAGPAEMAIYQLLERAGTDEFKAMLKHVR